MRTAQRFWSFVKKQQREKCWEWQGALHGKGYGHLRWQGKVTGAHRVAYELSKGPIKKGLLVLHKCDNPRCCNPRHLFIGTYKDNSQDAKKKGRCAGQKITLQVAREMQRLYDKGWRTKSLAKRFNVCMKKVYGIVSNRDWADPTRGKPKRVRSLHKLSKKKVRLIKKLYRPGGYKQRGDGKSSKELAKMFGVTQTDIYYVLKNF